MKTIGITGGTGFVGRHLAAHLADKGYAVVIFSRSSKSSEGAIRHAHWDPDGRKIDVTALQNLDAMVHLAGAGVADKRWTPERKKEIVDSRVAATEFLISQLAAHAPRCKTFVAASATGYYGPDRSGSPFTEDDPPYTDFLAKVCVAWERASMTASDRYRTAIFRFGIVLGKDGGAYPELAGPMKFGIMPILGSGRQMVSWIHVADIAGMIRTALEDESCAGIYNAVAPGPVAHKTLMQTIAGAKGGIRIPAPVPPFVLGIIMGEASIEVLKSCTVSSKKAEALPYTFQYPTVASAVAAIVNS